jgi:hypothetical protein
MHIEGGDAIIADHRTGGVENVLDDLRAIARPTFVR